MTRTGSPDAQDPVDSDAGDHADAGDEADAGSAGKYIVCTYIGALDRIGIWRRDAFTNDECALMVLVSPGEVRTPFEFQLPPRWGTETLRLGQGDGCDCRNGHWLAGADATAGTGEVTFDVPDGGYWPKSLSIDAVVTFQNGREVHFDARDLVVGP